MIYRTEFKNSVLDGFWPCEEFSVTSNLSLVAKMIQTKSWQGDLCRDIDVIG